jgi:hypothetical protein
MNHEIQILVDKANKIMNKTGNKPGTRYPETLKKIVISMRLDHNMSVREIMKHVGVSSYSARVWAIDFKKQNVFRELVVKEHQNKKITTELSTECIDGKNILRFGFPLNFNGNLDQVLRFVEDHKIQKINIKDLGFTGLDHRVFKYDLKNLDLILP